jgi:hypothetical protein
MDNLKGIPLADLKKSKKAEVILKQEEVISEE